MCIKVKKEFIKNMFKEKGEVIDARIGSLDVYTISETWSSNFEENILCLSGDLKTNRLIKLGFWGSSLFQEKI